MATASANPKATKDTFLVSPAELVNNRDWNGRWHAIKDEPAPGNDQRSNSFDGAVSMSIRELANSIKEIGQLEDVLVVKRPADAQGRTLHTVAGLSRVRAILLNATEDPNGDHKVRVRVLPGNVDDKQAFLINEEENRSRNNLTTLDKAYCMSREKALGIPADEIAKRWGCTVQAVSQALSLIDAPEEVKEAVYDGVITATNVIADMRDLKDEEKLEIVTTARTAKAKNIAFSSSDLKKMARQFKDARAAAAASAAAAPSPDAPTTDGTTGEQPANGAMAPAAPQAAGPKRRGPKPNTEKGPAPGVSDLRKLLKGRQGALSVALLRYLDGYLDMDANKLAGVLDAFEYADGEKPGDGPTIENMGPRTEGNPVDDQAHGGNDQDDSQADPQEG